MAASAGMAIAYPIIPKVLAAFSVKSLLLIDLVLQFFLSWVCARTQNADILIVCSFVCRFSERISYVVVYSLCPKDFQSEECT